MTALWACVSAPTAPHPLAQPNGLGNGQSNIRRPEGPRYGSIQRIFFAEGNVIPFQQPPVFVLERHFLVMLRLVANKEERAA
jgi:hypothetical protein